VSISCSGVNNSIVVNDTNPSSPLLIKCSIAVQLQESKLSMEAQLRAEIQAEYMIKLQEMKLDGNKNILELESKLREELSQVKDERERWKSEQEDLMKIVRESQQQFESVREVFKSMSFIFLLWRKCIT
jgi:hypothetical protein